MKTPWVLDLYPDVTTFRTALMGLLQREEFGTIVYAGWTHDLVFVDHKSVWMHYGTRQVKFWQTLPDQLIVVRKLLSAHQLLNLQRQ